MKKRKFLLIDMYPTSLTYKLLYSLKDYFEITYIILQNKEFNLLEDYKKWGIKIYFFDFKKQKLKNGLKLIWRLFLERIRGYDFVLGRAGPNWPTYLIFKLFESSKKIYLPYDIFLYLWKDQSVRPKIGIFFEKSNLKNADFIIHKGPKDQLKLLKKNGITHLKSKPIQFIPCFEEWIVPLNKKKTDQLSVAYIGIAPKDDPLFRVSWADEFKQISKQNIDLHLFILKAAKIQEFEKLSERNIFYHNPLSNKRLNEEISKYHYGLAATFFNKDIVDERMLKTSIGNKFLSYLEAGIPIIINDELEFCADLVRKYNCGVVISEKDLSNLREVLEKQDYQKLLLGVKRAREDLRLSKYNKIFLKELGL